VRFPTPNSLPAEVTCRQIFIPNDPLFLGAFTGALLELTNPDRWEHYGAITPTEAAEAAIVILYEYLNSACEGGMFDVRQNTETPCKLEKSTDGGATWVEFADLQKCPPRLRRNPETGEIEYTVDGETWEPIETGPYTGEDAPPSFPEPRSRPAGTNDEKMCDAAYAAAHVLQAVYRQTWDTFLVGATMGALWIAQQFADIAESLLGGILGINGAVSIGASLGQQSALFTEGGFPDSDLNTVMCILLENASVATGDRVVFDYEDVKTAFAAENTTPFIGLNFLLNLFLGEDGLNAAGNVNMGAADCDVCEPSPCLGYWNLREAATPLHALNGDANWQSGNGWYKNGLGPYHEFLEWTCPGGVLVNQIQFVWHNNGAGINWGWYCSYQGANVYGEGLANGWPVGNFTANVQGFNGGAGAMIDRIVWYGMIEPNHTHISQLNIIPPA